MNQGYNPYRWLAWVSAIPPGSRLGEEAAMQPTSFSEAQRAFVRAVVAAAAAHGFSRVVVRFGHSYADEVSARWDGGKITLSVESAETIDQDKD